MTRHFRVQMNLDELSRLVARSFAETIRDNLHFNKFSVGELLFVEYKCPIEQDVAGAWTPIDYFVHVVSGKKTWRTTEGSWTLEKGQTLFFKKGAAIVHQDFREDFCLLVFFVSDDFTREVVKEVSGQLSSQHDGDPLHQGAILVNGDMTLAAYFQSMLAYFTGTAKPADSLLTLKLKELIVSILLGRNNPELAAYFQSLLKSDAPPLSQIMEANFCYNLGLEDFAKLTHRSLSTFKRDFQKYYKQSPGKWLLHKAAGLLSRAAEKSRAERFPSRPRLRLRRPLPFQPGVQGQIRRVPGALPQGKPRPGRFIIQRAAQSNFRPFQQSTVRRRRLYSAAE